MFELGGYTITDDLQYTDFNNIWFVFGRASSMQVNNINDQLDATITILLIFESVQQVSGKHLPEI
jgi:hypothetical protein